jgi:hypothetical protein
VCPIDAVFCVVALRGLVGNMSKFRSNIIYPSLELKYQKVAVKCSPKNVNIIVPTSLHGVKAQKLNIDVFIAARASNIILF